MATTPTTPLRRSAGSHRPDSLPTKPAQRLPVDDDCATRPHARRALSNVLFLTAFAVLSIMSWSASAGEFTKDEMRSLDERVQAIKGDVLQIAAELTQLEEKLLFPSDSQVAVFVSVSGEHFGELDSVEIQIDGEPVARHVYSFKELEALKKGGVQRVYTGNTTTGQHVISVSVTGKHSDGRALSRTKQFTVAKEIGPKLVSLRLATSQNGDLQIELGDG